MAGEMQSLQEIKDKANGVEEERSIDPESYLSALAGMSGMAAAELKAVQMRRYQKNAEDVASEIGKVAKQTRKMLNRDTAAGGNWAKLQDLLADQEFSVEKFKGEAKRIGKEAKRLTRLGKGLGVVSIIPAILDYTKGDIAKAISGLLVEDADANAGDLPDEEIVNREVARDQVRRAKDKGITSIEELRNIAKQYE